MMFGTLPFIIWFQSLYSGNLCTIGTCDLYALTPEALTVHARVCPALPEYRKRQLCDEFRDKTPLH